MKQERSTVQFENYNVTKMHYSVCFDRKTEKGDIFLDPVFNVETKKFGDKTYLLSVNVKVGMTEDSRLPFVAEVELVGRFNVENVEDPEKTIRKNGLAILYPYVRATLSALTLTANRAPVVLPTINIVKMLENQNNN